MYLVCSTHSIIGSALKERSDEEELSVASVDSGGSGVVSFSCTSAVFARLASRTHASTALATHDSNGRVVERRQRNGMTMTHMALTVINSDDTLQ